ncbi:MAG TPA: ferritin-like domain-containing protein [Yinghuangia sp.]|uniref:ferritin-like domain-containing protein n=1 Tax=Yinghuangia sp. YIM S10712 TaxID=3436930 RepID=UPI002C310874|nr:ferritin-like domain-containing protein [Yinghuangia sp.]
MEDPIDTRLLAELTEQSEDLHSDASRITRASLDEYGQATETQHRKPPPRTRRWWRPGLLGGAAAGAVLLGAGRAGAANADDIKALQTAASLENLAVNVYTTAAGLPFVRDGNKVVAAFIEKTTVQHRAHAQAFNSAAVEAGGREQTGPDPKYAAIVQQTLPTIKTPADVVKLAITLEDVAAQTYTKNVAQVSDPALRRLFASVAPVEAQHKAVLLAVQALLAGNAPDLIALPPDAARLPAAAGSVGFPDAFQSTKDASPIDEGAVK